jgi:hypothetical protein
MMKTDEWRVAAFVGLEFIEIEEDVQALAAHKDRDRYAYGRGGRKWVVSIANSVEPIYTANDEERNEM